MKPERHQVIDVLTYKGDGVAEKRHNENGKIDYFAARSFCSSQFRVKDGETSHKTSIKM